MRVNIGESSDGDMEGGSLMMIASGCVFCVLYIIFVSLVSVSVGFCFDWGLVLVRNSRKGRGVAAQPVINSRPAPPSNQGTITLA